jgi:hypothetical protein
MMPSRLRPWLAMVLVVFAGLSCSGDPVSPNSQKSAPAPSQLLDQLPGTDRLPIVGGLLRCTPLPYAAAEAVVGPQGGSLAVGPHLFVVPPGALSQPVRIRAELPVETVNSIRFSPEGLQFQRKAVLTMSYANCPLVRNLLPKRIAYTNERLTILELLASLDNLLTRKVTAGVDHFSRYAIAW